MAVGTKRSVKRLFCYKKLSAGTVYERIDGDPDALKEAQAHHEAEGYRCLVSTVHRTVGEKPKRRR